MYVPPPLPSPQHMLALMMSYPNPSQRKFKDAYKFLNENSGNEKRKELFFVNSTYTITIKMFICS